MAANTEVELEILDAHSAVATTSSQAPRSIHRDASVSNSTVENPLPTGRYWLVIAQLAGMNLANSFSNGLLTVSLPATAENLGLQEGLLVWPASAFFLTSGTLLLLAGSITDVVGPRSINLTGGFFTACFMLACGLSRSGIELIIFRAMQGIANALVVPSGVSIASTSVANGKRRNVGFACLGLSMPLGFSFGLVLGGVFVKTTGWRAGYYVGGAVCFALFVIGVWALPNSARRPEELPILHRLAAEIDWIGSLITSVCLATLSYVLAMLSADVTSIKSPTSISLLCLSFALMPAFALWMRRQENLSKPALIPNGLWKNATFSSVCIMVLLINAVCNCMELFSSLFFQEVQSLSALGASVRLLPNLLVGTCVNLITGVIIDRVPAVWAILISSGLCAISPLLMAVIDPQWPYWYDAFFAQLLCPISSDVLFTVGLLVVSDVFPARTQALAGAVFSTCSQIGASIGLSLVSVISSTVTQDSRTTNKQSPEALMEGYRASFWTLFAWMLAACLIGGVGLRKLGKVGMKRD